jgi:predicted small metal-binding protein
MHIPEPPVSYNLFCKGDRMAKVINCRDVGVDCDFQARGETVEEVLQKCAEHARSDHGMEQIPPELEAAVRNAMRDE